MSKTVIGGKVTQVGWKPGSRSNMQIYALIEVKIATTKRQDRAEKQLQKLRERVLGKKVAIFPQS